VMLSEGKAENLIEMQWDAQRRQGYAR